ncbi:MAG: hypothetical protein C5S44_01290 [Candidatus Methanocomedens sp.]|nr:MAG: hypothetical protein C5S44_01290 [ANME-2 cluster archaeon]
MKGDYSRIPFNERKKMQHYRKVYHQQGKVLLDSDLNENTDLLHYQMKTLVKDGLCGSPNIGFRIGRGVPLLPVDDHRYIGEEGKGWSCTNDGTLTVDYFEKFEGKGSLKLKNATKVIFSFQKPVDLSKYRYLRLALDPTAANAQLALVRFDGINEPNIELIKQLQTSDQNGFSVIKYVFPPNAVLDNITKVILTGIEISTKYHLGAVECSPPMFTLEPMTHLKGWSFDTDKPESVEISVDGEVIKVSQITRLYKRHFSTVDFSKFETMEFAISSNSTSLIQFYVSDKDGNTSYWKINSLDDELKKYSIDITNKEDDSEIPAVLASIKEYGFRELSDSEGNYYHFGSILYEMSLENNFVISGKYPLSGETGRLYVDGELYEKEGAETYLNQKDYSSAPSIEPDDGIRKDLVYVDVWQRHVTSAEDPELREVAVGVDTCNRMKAVAQVKVLAGETSLPPDLKPTGSGRLSTAVEYTETEKLCKITPGVEYTGLENRLYRVEIHTPGEVESATYKWSKNNSSTVSQIIENVKEDAASVRVKNVKLFEIGDIIEITDDRVEFADRKYINEESSIRPWGELRKITSIDRDKNVLGWEKEGEGASDDPLSMTGGLPHDYTAEGEETTHPRVIKWDGAKPTSNEETLEDGITIRFSGSDMLPGDYWTFTARENTRTVEKLDNELPQGVVHCYYPLATIEWDENGEIINVTDLRTRFEPLCGITAADLAFDNANAPKWKDAKNVQQALENLPDPEAGGVKFESNCDFLYGDVDNVQAALDHLCNGITVPSLTLKGKDGEQDNWPKLECSKNRDLVGIENGLQIGMSVSSYNNFYVVSNFSNGLRGFRLYKGDDSHLLTVSANGNVGIGTPVPKNRLDVEGGAVIGNGYSGTQTAPGNGLLVQGNVGIGTPEPKNRLDVEGGAVIGALYSGTQTAPSNGLLVQGNVGIGTDNTKFGHLTIQDSAVSLAFRETGKAVDQGGLWRIPLDNGTLRFDVNTGAQGSEFGQNHITPLKMTKEGEVIVAGELKAPFFKAGQGNKASVTEGKWYRIAENKEGGKRANAEFTLRDHSGGHSTLTFRIGISYNDATGMSFTVLNHSRYLTTTFTKIRVLEKGTQDTQYLEVLVNRTGSVDYSIYDNLQKNGWDPVDWEEITTLPTGYTTREFEVDKLFIVGDYENRFIVDRGGNVGIGTQEPGARLDIANMSQSENKWFRLGDGGDGGRLWVEYGAMSAPLLVMSDKDEPPRIQFQQTGDDENEDDPQFISWIGHAKGRSSDLAFMGGNVGIGTSEPGAKLDVRGDIVLRTAADGSGNPSVDMVKITNNVFLVPNQGNVSIGITKPKNKLDVSGAVVIGEKYSGNRTAPADGLLVQGNVGIGTKEVDHDLQIGNAETAVSMSLRGPDGNSESGVLAFEDNNGTNQRWFKLIHDSQNNLLKVTSKEKDPIITFDRTNGNVDIGGSHTYLSGSEREEETGWVYKTHWIMGTDKTKALGFKIGHPDTGSGSTKEIVTGPEWIKNFLIHHPLDPEHKNLIHSTLEGPEVGVFYRGEAQLSNGEATVLLPDYFEALTRKENRTILLTPKFEGDNQVSMLAVSGIKDGKFTVKMIDRKNSSQKFYWEVKAVRADVDILKVERMKTHAE